MRIVVTTDAHGTNGVTAAHRMGIWEEASAVIICGDVWALPYKPTVVPIHAIRGNHEPVGMDTWWAKGRGTGGMHLHDDYTTFTLGGLRFGVIGRMDEGTHKHLNPLDAPPTKGMPITKPGMWLGDPSNRAFEPMPLDEVAELFEGCDVLLFHDSPHPFDERGAGSHFLTDVVKAVKPLAVFHGHMHKERRRLVDDVMVVGLPPCDPAFADTVYAVLDTDGPVLESVGRVAKTRVSKWVLDWTGEE